MWDKEWGDRPDTQNLTDGSLKVWQVLPVTQLGMSVKANVLIQFLLDLLLYLRKVTELSKSDQDSLRVGRLQQLSLPSPLPLWLIEGS